MGWAAFVRAWLDLPTPAAPLGFFPGRLRDFDFSVLVRINLKKMNPVSAGADGGSFDR